MRQDLIKAHALLAKKEKRKLDEDFKAKCIAKFLKVVLDAQASCKDQKISTQSDGHKIGNVVRSWLSEFDD